MKPCGSAGLSRREFQAYLSINPTTRDHICSCLTINGASGNPGCVPRSFTGISTWPEIGFGATVCRGRGPPEIR
jgi:hypothetical protein